MQILNASLGRRPTINQATSYVVSSAIMNLIDMSAVAASSSQTPILKSSRFEEKSRCLPHVSNLKEPYGTELLLTSIALLNATHRFRFCVPEAVYSLSNLRSHSPLITILPWLHIHLSPRTECVIGLIRLHIITHSVLNLGASCLNQDSVDYRLGKQHMNMI